MTDFNLPTIGIAAMIKKVATEKQDMTTEQRKMYDSVVDHLISITELVAAADEPYNRVYKAMEAFMPHYLEYDAVRIANYLSSR